MAPVVSLHQQRVDVGWTMAFLSAFRIANICNLPRTKKFPMSQRGIGDLNRIAGFSGLTATSVPGPFACADRIFDNGAHYGILPAW